MWRGTYRALRKQFKIPVCCRVHIYVTYRGGVAHAPLYSGSGRRVFAGSLRLCHWNVMLFIVIEYVTQGFFPYLHGVTGIEGKSWDLCM